ncbi:MAG: helix-turn-helix domain-containing protein [bacterium]|nr:helix-turn-helix domain-containing protein [bacterium]
MEFNKRDKMRSIGLKLKRVREQFGHPRRKMAAHLGMSDNGYGKNEFGVTSPGLRTLYLLKTDFDISMNWLFFDDGPMHNEDKKRVAQLEKENEELKARLAEALGGNEAEGEGYRLQETTNQTLAPGQPGLRPDVKGLVEEMKRNPLLYYEVMAFYHRFKEDRPTKSTRKSKG